MYTFPCGHSELGVVEASPVRAFYSPTLRPTLKTAVGSALLQTGQRNLGQLLAVRFLEGRPSLGRVVGLRDGQVRDYLRNCDAGELIFVCILGSDAEDLLHYMSRCLKPRDSNQGFRPSIDERRLIERTLSRKRRLVEEMVAEGVASSASQIPSGWVVGGREN
ncbi:hypothetical protein AAG570_010752 [Ranatra chinensis]|uniref:Uncharacterized protein n=1 Tax=Ranatra chinensis TaxID=642074 RepID=A0ABD0YNE4_9HEMI